MQIRSIDKISRLKIEAYFFANDLKNVALELSLHEHGKTTLTL